MSLRSPLPVVRTPLPVHPSGKVCGGQRGHYHPHYVPFRHLPAEYFRHPGLHERHVLRSPRNVLLERGVCAPVNSSSSTLPFGWFLVSCPICLYMLDKEKS